jgi:hypothetical protein
MVGNAGVTIFLIAQELQVTISPFYAMGCPSKCFYHTGAEYSYALS